MKRNDVIALSSVLIITFFAIIAIIVFKLWGRSLGGRNGIY